MSTEQEQEKKDKQTCLYDKHVALGALMSPFGGFVMPIQYVGIVQEHNAASLLTRTRRETSRHLNFCAPSVQFPYF